MKKALLTTAISIVALCSLAQVPGVKWTNYYRNINNYTSEALLDAKTMPDGGFILVGNDSSYSYDEESYLRKDITARPNMLRTDLNGTVI
jgi:hypothetical protein